MASDEEKRERAYPRANERFAKHLIASFVERQRQHVLARPLAKAKRNHRSALAAQERPNG